MWPESRVGDLAKIEHGYPFPGELFTTQPTPMLILTPGNFAIGGGFQLRPGKEKFYAGEVEPRYVLEPGELLVTMTDLSQDTATLGYPAFVPAIDGVRCLHNQRIGKVVLQDSASIDIRFLYYVLCSDDYREEIIASATGTAVKHTAPSRIEAYRFRVPPLSIQRNIAAVLSSLDEKADLNRRTSRSLDAMAQALFRSWFVDFDPVAAKREGKRPLGMDATTAALFPSHFQESELGSIPAGWMVAGLDQLATFLNGLPLQKYPADEGDSLPVVKIAELRTENTEDAERAGRQIPPEYVINNGDIVFSWSGSLLATIWCGGEGALNQHLFKVTSTDYPKWFVYYWIQEHMDEFRDIAADKATTMGHIKRHHLRDARVVIPSREILAAADAILGPFLDLQVKLRLERRPLMALRDLLIPRLLSGEVRLNDAEKAVG